MDKAKIKEELDALIIEGKHLYYAGIMLCDENYFASKTPAEKNFASQAFKAAKDPHGDYYTWYGNARRMMRMLAPENLENFERLFNSYIEAWLMKPSDNSSRYFSKFEVGFRTQRRILRAAAENIDHVLFNLESKIQYGFSKSEIDVAKELKENGLFRAAGAIAGVVIEEHLKTVATNRGIPLKPKFTISNYNDALRENAAYDMPRWRHIQMCGDIRNKCVHPKEEEPTARNIDEIISGAETIIATVS